jgi:hypothetical protein
MLFRETVSFGGIPLDTFCKSLKSLAQDPKFGSWYWGIEAGRISKLISRLGSSVFSRPTRGFDIAPRRGTCNEVACFCCIVETKTTGT